jgi:hypothetical protein
MYCNADPEATPTIADQGVDAEAAPEVLSVVIESNWRHLKKHCSRWSRPAELFRQPAPK